MSTEFWNSLVKRTRRRWEDDIKMNLRDVGGTGSVSCSVVSFGLAVLNLWVLK
jgi:hypothetical protein